MKMHSSFFTIDIRSLRHYRSFPFHLYLLDDDRSEFYHPEAIHPANWPMDEQRWELWKSSLAQGKKLKIQMCQHETYIRFTQWLEQNERELELAKEAVNSIIPHAPIGRWNSPRISVAPIESCENFTPNKKEVFPILGQWLSIIMGKKSSISKAGNEISQSEFKDQKVTSFAETKKVDNVLTLGEGIPNKSNTTLNRSLNLSLEKDEESADNQMTSMNDSDEVQNYENNDKKQINGDETFSNKPKEIIPDIPLDLPFNAPNLDQIPTEENEQLILLKQAIHSENFLPLILSVFKDIRSYTQDSSPLTCQAQLLACETLNQDNLTNRISCVAHLLAKQLGTRAQSSLIELFYASQIHHLGSLRLSRKLLSMAHIDYSPEDKQNYSQHGQNTIDLAKDLGVNLDSRIAQIILNHHGIKYESEIVIGPTPEVLGQILGICSNFFHFSMGISTGVSRSTKQVSEMIGDLDIIGLELNFAAQIIEKFVLLIQGKEIQEIIQKTAA